jgi:hypothetical protein
MRNSEAHGALFSAPVFAFETLVWRHFGHYGFGLPISHEGILGKVFGKQAKILAVCVLLFSSKLWTVSKLSLVGRSILFFSNLMPRQLILCDAGSLPRNLTSPFDCAQGRSVFGRDDNE